MYLSKTIHTDWFVVVVVFNYIYFMMLQLPLQTIIRCEYVQVWFGLDEISVYLIYPKHFYTVFEVLCNELCL